MGFEYGIKWLSNRESIVRFIESLISELEDLKARVVELREDQLLFKQGDYLEDLYVLLEGEVQLIKEEVMDGERVSMVSDNLEAGAFIGIIAFTTGNSSMTTAKVVKEGRAIRLKQEEFDSYLHQHQRLSYPLQQLMIANLVDRYQQNTALQIKLERLNRQLKKERNDLEKAYQDLENTQNLLVHKEKMATLGQLVAGFAHEINNPVSALLRSSELVMDQLPELLSKHGEISHLGIELFEAGLNSKPVSTDHLRQQMDELKEEFPSLARPVLRKIAQIPSEFIPEIQNRKVEEVDTLLERFETGKLLRNIQLASERIGNLVKSLKSYSRQDKNNYELLDIREGIHDTVLMLSNRLKYHEVELDLEEIPKTCGNMGELNQVWTNIIINACDAMDKKGRLVIRCHAKDDSIILQFQDSGPGIPKEIQEKIFEPNFTTKNQSKKFGLGLGLAISREIIRKHNGSIFFENAKEGGGIFTITLPVIHDSG